MSSLKSVFVTAYILALVGITGLAVSGIVGSRFSIGWLGAALTTAPFLIFLMWITATRSRARTSRRLPSIFAAAAVGLALSLWSLILGESGLLPAAAAGLGFVGFILYVFWYSNLGPRDRDHIAVGSPLPDFAVRDTTGARVESRSWRGRPTIVIFFRGNWCPLCMAQIKEVARHYREIEALGARVALVSPQRDTHTAELARAFDVAFEFYCDPQAEAARRLGIAHDYALPFGMQALGYDADSVLPTVAITDSTGVVRWAHKTDNYRIRPEPSLFLAELRAMDAPPPQETSSRM